MSAVDDEYCDAVFSSHNIEHLYPHDVPVALGEFLRILKPQGIAVITCPDLQSVCELVAQDKLTDTAYQSPAGPIAPIDILYGYRRSMAQGNYLWHIAVDLRKRFCKARFRAQGLKRDGFN